MATKSVQQQPQGYQIQTNHSNIERRMSVMEFFNSAIDTLQTLVIAIGAGLGVWGIINLLEGYGNDNPGAKSQGIKQLMSGAGIAICGSVLIPLLSGLFN
jgi:hypothetical protein